MGYFGTSGIRGIYGKKVTEELAMSIGAILAKRGTTHLAMARDTRSSGSALKKALIGGFSGNITDFGVVPTSLLCFGTAKVNAHTGMMITASHNPSSYNGFKFWNSDGTAYARTQEQEIEKALKKPASAPGDATVEKKDIFPDYLAAVRERVSLKGEMKVLIDPGNGAACSVTPKMLRGYGYQTIAINDRPDGGFPNRLPEPNHYNLKATMQDVKEKGAAVGFAHDGDADRMMAIDEKGNVVDFDRFLRFLCEHMMEETGIRKIITTVDASMLLDDIDGEVIRCKVGDTFVSQELTKRKAAFGGEPSGSFIFPEFGLWPDGVYAVMKTLSFLEKEDMPLSRILSQYPSYHHQRMKFDCPEQKKTAIMDSLSSMIPENAEITNVDGLRAKFDDFCLLIRPSGTEEYIRLNVESKSRAILDEQKMIWEQKVKEAINAED